MPSNKRGLAAASATGAGGAIYPEDLYTAIRYTGTGSAQDITGSVDLSGGGMVLIKSRSGATPAYIFDTVRGTGKYIEIGVSPAAEATDANSVTAFNSDGFSVGTSTLVNSSGVHYIAYCFRTYEGWFSIDTYTGDGSGSSRDVSHSLASLPKVIWHIKTDSGTAMFMGDKDGSNYYGAINITSNNISYLTTAHGNVATTTDIDVGWWKTNSDGSSNVSSSPYVLYCWGDEASFGVDSDASIVATGYVQTNGSGNWSDEDIGFEPQFCILKSMDQTGGWHVADDERGLFCDTTINPAIWFLNTDAAEVTTNNTLRKNTTGIHEDAALTANAQYWYFCIRMPMKTFSELGLGVDDVCEVQTWQGTAGSTPQELSVGFRPDIALIRVWWTYQSSTSYQHRAYDRMRGGGMRFRIGDHALQRQPNWNSFSYQDAAFTLSSGSDAEDKGDTTAVQNHAQFIRRVPGYCDIAYWEGTGVAQTIDHQLGVIPDFILVINLGTPALTPVYHSELNSGTAPEDYYINMDDSNVAETNDATFWNDTAPTATQFTVGTQADVNASGESHVAWLFCNVAGVLHCGRYTGTGAAQTIDCGFSNGIKALWVRRVTSGGSWYLFSEALTNGIVAGTDDYLTMSGSNAYLASADYIDPDNSGFALTTDTTINASSTDYIFVAFAA